MNGQDQFEERLQRCQPAQVPHTWREEILGSARAAAAAPHTARADARGLQAALYSQISAWLWPHPKAWAGLAAAWLLVLGLNLGAGESSRLAVARPGGRLSPEMREMLKEQEEMFAELAGPMENPEADRPRPAGPQPRSERRGEIMNG